MSVLEDLKKVILLVDHVEKLQESEQYFETRVRELEARVTFLEAREDAIVLLAEKAARKAAMEAFQQIAAEKLPRLKNGIS